VRADVLGGLARVRLLQDRAADALPLAREADEFWSSFAPDSRWAGEAALWLGRCYLALGRTADAAGTLARAERILSHSPLPGDATLVRLAQARRR